MVVKVEVVIWKVVQVDLVVLGDSIITAVVVVAIVAMVIFMLFILTFFIVYILM